MNYITAGIVGYPKRLYFYTADAEADEQAMNELHRELLNMVARPEDVAITTRLMTRDFECRIGSLEVLFSMICRDRLPLGVLQILADMRCPITLDELLEIEKILKQTPFACEEPSLVEKMYDYAVKNMVPTSLTPQLLNAVVTRADVAGSQGQTSPRTCVRCSSFSNPATEYKIKMDGVMVKTWLCRKCYHKSVFKCPVCGEECDVRFSEVLDGVRVCRECLDTLMKKHSKSIYFCVGCREFHTKQKYGKNRVNENKWICDMMIPQCTKCDSCGMLLFGSTYEAVAIMRSFSGGQYCSKCYTRDNKYFIKRYHDDPPMQFYEVGEDGKNLSWSCEKAENIYYGLELEVDAGGQRDDISKPTLQLLNDEAYAMRDGSLEHGFEIITFPHTEDALYNMNWGETFKFLVKNGYRSHDINTCGLHLHVNRRCFGADPEIRRMNIAKLMYFFETNRDEFIKLSRREEAHINRWAKFYANRGSNVNLNYYLLVYDRYNRSNSHDDRYKAINLCKRATVEFRLMRGTLKLDTFLATLDVLITISKNSNTTSGTSPRDWLKGIKPATIQYLKENKIFEGEI